MVDGRSAPAPDDAALVAAVALGNEDALAALYDRHAGAVHATALRLTGDRQVAEDVVQEVFLTLWNRAERFDPRIGSLPAWLGTIARHRSVDHLRAVGRRPRLVSLGDGPSDESPDEALDRVARSRAGAAGELDASGPAAAIDAAEARAEINAALLEMPEPEREVILLAYRDELSQSEIAARLGRPLGTVKTRTRRALARLRVALADVYGPSLAPVPLEEDDEVAGGRRRDAGGAR